MNTWKGIAIYQLFKGKTIWLLLDWNTMGVLRDRDRNTVALGSSVNAFFKSQGRYRYPPCEGGWEARRLTQGVRSRKSRDGLQLRLSRPDSNPVPILTANTSPQGWLERDTNLAGAVAPAVLGHYVDSALKAAF